MMNEQQKLLQSIRDFLEQEQKTFGPFQIPDASPNSEPSDTTMSASGSSSSQPASSLTIDTAETLDDLYEVWIHADELKTDLQSTNLVFGTGNPNADIMFIGEAPGKDEDRMREPFVGSAGKLLNKILQSIHFQRDEVYIANILKHRPPDNRDPHPEERSRSLPYLIRQIDLIQPKWIVCLGKVSAQTLLETQKPLKKLRGSFHPFRGSIKLMVTFHPAALLRNPSWKRETWEDVKMLRKEYDKAN